MAVTLVISPHYDDAVLSCGHWLGQNQGARISTVCTAHPGRGSSVSDWDRDSGFIEADEAMISRRAEDRGALMILGCHQGPPIEFLDGEYRAGQDLDLDLLAGAIRGLIDSLQATRCLVPLGVYHVDHIQTGIAARQALEERPEVEAIVYGDLPYRVYPEAKKAYSEVLQAKIKREGFALRDDVYWTRPIRDDLKQRAAARYGSQIGRFDQTALSDSMRLDAERYWHLQKLR